MLQDAGSEIDKDIDFLVDGDLQALLSSLAPKLGAEIKEFPDYLTAKLVAPKMLASISELDFAQPRSEIYDTPGRLPRVIGKTTVIDDLNRRDFSVNAIALPIDALQADLAKSAICAPSALEDLKNLAIRVLHPRAFLDDPSRLVRAIRYAVRLNGDLEPETKQLFEQALKRGALATVDHFRLRRELERCFIEGDPPRNLEMLAKHGVLDKIGLLEPATLNQVVEQLRSLRPSTPVAAWELIYKYSPLETRGSVFERLGFSKKKIQALEDASR